MPGEIQEIPSEKCKFCGVIGGHSSTCVLISESELHKNISPQEAKSLQDLISLFVFIYGRYPELKTKVNSKFIEQRARELLTKREIHSYLLKVKQEVVGVAQFEEVSFDGRKKAFFQEHIIEPAFRRKGLSRYLEISAINGAKTVGCEEVYALVSPTNIASQQALSKVGFSISKQPNDAFSNFAKNKGRRDFEDYLYASLQLNNNPEA